MITKVDWDERKATNVHHATNPEVGDYWHEMFVPVAIVIMVNTHWVLFQKLNGRTVVVHPGEPVPEVMSRKDFKKWLKYESLENTWACVVPGKYKAYAEGKET